jgi:hypothetical protein
MSVSKKVDVLGMLNIIADYMDDNPNTSVTYSGCVRDAYRVVAELIEVAQEILKTDDAALLELRNLGLQAPLETHELTNKLRVALAKVQP